MSSVALILILHFIVIKVIPIIVMVVHGSLCIFLCYEGNLRYLYYIYRAWPYFLPIAVLLIVYE